MCGIVGYAGGDSAAKIIYDGLLKLEYRGYDSAGIAVMEQGKITVAKRVGRVQKLAPSVQILEGNIGIGHTRWATHGKPSDENAHPHTFGKITVVHNGIIENYAELKSELSAEGRIFLSETDSEVIAALIDKFYDGDLLKAVIDCARMLKGSYALLAMCEGEERIVAAKYRSPVILGLGGNGNFVVSDEPALAGNCPELCVLEDGDFAVITPLSVAVYDSMKNPVIRAVYPVAAKEQSIVLRGYPHYMIKELWESPSAVSRTLSEFAKVQYGVEKLLKDAKKIILTGCGTAYHAALVGKRYFCEICKKSAEAEYAGELRYDMPVIGCGTVLVAVTQSGETADTVEAARLYKSLNAKVIAVTNCPHSAITRISDAVVPVAAGPEICVAATKSYSAQIAALLSMALAVGRSPECEVLKRELLSAPSTILKTLEEIDIYALAEMCARSRGVYFMGRGIDYALALEASLKLKEVSYIAGCGYPASELKHGALALIDGGTLSVFLINDEALASKSANAVEQTISRGGMVSVITSLREVGEQFSGRAEVITLPSSNRYLSPFAAAAAVQFLAYRTAVTLGINPDKPRNLAKSVTVE